MVIYDRPATLAKVAQLVGDASGNFLEVQHQRNFPRVPAKSAELDLILEIRARDQLPLGKDFYSARGVRILPYREIRKETSELQKIPASGGSY